MTCWATTTGPVESTSKDLLVIPPENKPKVDLTLWSPAKFYLRSINNGTCKSSRVLNPVNMISACHTEAVLGWMLWWMNGSGHFKGWSQTIIMPYNPNSFFVSTRGHWGSWWVCLSQRAPLKTTSSFSHAWSISLWSSAPKLWTDDIVHLQKSNRIWVKKEHSLQSGWWTLNETIQFIHSHCWG